MKISRAIFRQEDVGDQWIRVGSKKACPESVEGSVQQGRSHVCARSVLVRRELGKMARTPLTAFFNRPLLDCCLIAPMLW